MLIIHIIDRFHLIKLVNKFYDFYVCYKKKIKCLEFNLHFNTQLTKKY